MGSTTEGRVAPYEADPVSGILFINQAREHTDRATRDITRRLMSEKRKLIKEGILKADAPKGKIHEAKCALDAALTLREKSFP